MHRERPRIDAPAMNAGTAAAPATAHRIELLAPAGGAEAFRAALGAGADAIYMGMGDFNARRKAENFTDEAFADACRAAHLAGARVYVTVNIVIKDAEMPRALELVRRCAVLGADAFIIQDWGLFFEIRRLMPDLELHVSTQANIHDARGVAWCRDAGAERVTLSRELSIDEIDRIHRAVDTDLEVFAHGSICFCYSGVCLLSSFACRGRSANRGMCAQPCRLPYELVDATGRVVSAPGRERALCPRDTNTVDIVERLVNAGASALKLEGRMKAPEYVFSITDAYRRALDAVEAGRDLPASEKSGIDQQLKRCFNRDFTHAYQDGTSGDEMMSYERSNNRGQVVGTVTAFEPRTPKNRSERFRARDKGPAGRAVVRLTEPVGARDLIELRPVNDPDSFLTAIAREGAPAGASIGLEIPRPIAVGSVARIIRSQEALDRTDAVLTREHPRKRAVTVRVVARIGAPFAVELACADRPELVGRAEGFMVEAARTRAVTADDLREHVGRLGSTPFAAASFDVDLDDGAGMGFSAVHAVRAEAARALEEAIAAPYARRAERLAHVDLSPAAGRAAARGGEAGGPGTDRPPVASREAELCAIAADLGAAEAAREAGAARVYLAVDALDAAGIAPEDAERLDVIPILDEVSRAADLARLDRWVVPGAPVAVGTISELALAAERGACAELRPTVPVHNRAALGSLVSRGAHGIWLSPEIALEEIAPIAADANVPIGITVWGRPRVMTSEHCVLQAANACIHDCTRCRLRGRELFLKNIDGRRLPVRTDIHGRSRIYDVVVTDISPQVGKLMAAGVTRLLVDGTLSSATELRQQVAHAARQIAAARRGTRPAPRQMGAGTGCLLTGVD